MINLFCNQQRIGVDLEVFRFHAIKFVNPSVNTSDTKTFFLWKETFWNAFPIYSPELLSNGSHSPSLTIVAWLTLITPIRQVSHHHLGNNAFNFEIQNEEEDQCIVGLHSHMELRLQKGQRVSHPIDTELKGLIPSLVDHDSFSLAFEMIHKTSLIHFTGWSSTLTNIRISHST